MKKIKEIVFAAVLLGFAGLTHAAPTIDTEIVITPGNPYSHHHLLLSLVDPDPDITQVKWTVDGATDDPTFISDQLPDFLLNLGYADNGQIAFFSPGEHAVDALLFRSGLEAETVHTTYTPTGNEIIPDGGSTAVMLGLGCLCVTLMRKRH